MGTADAVTRGLTPNNKDSLMNKLMPMALATLLVAATPSLLLAAEPMEPSGVAQAAMSTDPDDFFESAASANMFEIEASKVALERSQDPSVKKYAEMMIKDHTEAGTKLSALATSKKVTLPTQLLKRHQMMLDGLKEEKAGKEFDDEYRLKMVVSHKEAVSLFDESARKSPDADVRKLAGEMLPKLKAHGGEAEHLRKHADDKKS
jgi:putative membrane protein